MGTRTDIEVVYYPNGTQETIERIVETFPRILSKTAFQDHAVSQLGGGVTGMARFTEIMDATAAHSNGAVRFAFARYEAALTFEKSNVSSLTSLLVSSGVMTANERTEILDNWPEA